MKKKLIILGIIIFFILAVIIGLVIAIPKIKGYMPYYYDLHGKNQQDKPYTLEIDKADFENEVVKELYDNGVVCSSIRFLNYINENSEDL